MIHVALCFNDASGVYHHHVYTVLVSLFENRRRPDNVLGVHLVSDESFTPTMRRSFQDLCAAYGHELHVHTVSPSAIPLEHFQHITANSFGVAALYRCMLHEILPLGRVIYLDCDVIFQCDIADLADEVTEDSALAACLYTPGAAEAARAVARHEHTPGFTINTGVLFMNLARLRELSKHGNIFFAELDRLAAQYELSYPDQDAINALVTRNILSLQVLPSKFNYMMSMHGDCLPPRDLQDKILHFCGAKPWKEYLPGMMYYYKYFMLTPWAEEFFSLMLQSGGGALQRGWWRILSRPVRRHPRGANRLHEVCTHPLLFFARRLFPKRYRKNIR